MEAAKSAKNSKKTSATASPAPASKTAFTGDPENRRYDTDGVDTNRTESKVRNGCIGLIYNGLAYRSTESSAEVIARAVAVESAAFKLFKEEESADYKKKIRSLFSNLKNKANKELRRGVLSGDIAADRFVAMTDEDLKSEELRKKELELEKENMKKAQVPMAEKSISDSLECGRCKKKKVSYTQAQTRSADEPMTTFCECMNCGHRWKVSRKGALACGGVTANMFVTVLVAVRKPTAAKKTCCCVFIFTFFLFYSFVLFTRLQRGTNTGEFY